MVVVHENHRAHRGGDSAVPTSQLRARPARGAVPRRLRARALAACGWCRCTRGIAVAVDRRDRRTAGCRGSCCRVASLVIGVQLRVPDVRRPRGAARRRSCAARAASTSSAGSASCRSSSSPRLWTAWHDRVHHANAQPRRRSRHATRRSTEYQREPRGSGSSIDAFSLGGRRWRGVLSLILGFTVQSAHQLLTRAQRGFLTPREHRLRDRRDRCSASRSGPRVAALVGFVPFLFVFVLPLARRERDRDGVHPHEPQPEPARRRSTIRSSAALSVTTPRWIEWLTLRLRLSTSSTTCSRR